MKLETLLDDVDYSLVTTEEEREAVYRLRYDCYLAEGAIGPNENDRFHDEFDGLPNSFLFAVRYRGRLASSIRLHVATPDFPSSPSMTAFGDILGEITGRGEAYVDPTRFVVDERIRSETSLIPYATLRLASMAADHFDTEHIIATARLEHTPFYRRIFQLIPRTPPRSYLGLVKPLCLLSNEMDTIRHKVYVRYPIFSSNPAERIALFGPSRSQDFSRPAPLRANDDGGRTFRKYPVGQQTAAGA